MQDEVALIRFMAPVVAYVQLTQFGQSRPFGAAVPYGSATTLIEHCMWTDFSCCMPFHLNYWWIVPPTPLFPLGPRLSKHKMIKASNG
jgi:hypothetical protein